MDSCSEKSIDKYGLLWVYGWKVRCLESSTVFIWEKGAGMDW